MRYDLEPLAEIPMFAGMAMHGHILPNRCCHACFDSLAHELAVRDVRVFAPHNYYCFDGYPEMARLAMMRAGAYMVNAAEVITTAPDERTYNDPESRVYACIVGASSLPDMPAMADAIFTKIRQMDEARMRAIYEKANHDLWDFGRFRLYYDTDADIFCSGLPDSARANFVMQERLMILRLIDVWRKAGNRLDELVKALTNQDVDEFDLLTAEDVLRSGLLKKEKPWHVPVCSVGIDEVFAAADDLGALRFYPRLGDYKESTYTDIERDDDAFLDWVVETGFHGIEIIMSRNSSGDINRIVPKARQRGLLAIAGEEQNSGRMCSVTPFPRDRMLSADIFQALWVDALVVVAHQELDRAGQFGWDGEDHSDENRQYLAKIGANILEQTYWDK